MNIIFTSESIGKASANVRKILDRYATRIGSDSWEASLTQEGLNTVKTLLNRASSRKSSVACHRITNDGTRVLAWAIGNTRMFNRTGACATGTTAKRLRKEDTNQPYPVRLVIRIISITGLLHDIGKANTAFQAVIRNSGKLEAFRHEAVSAMMLAWLSGHEKDADWINAFIAAIEAGHLSKEISKSLTAEALKHATQLNPDTVATEFTGAGPSSCEKTPVLFGLIWLITAHHRLPGGDILISSSSASINSSEQVRYKKNDIPPAAVTTIIKNGRPWENESWTNRLTDDLKSLLALIEDPQFTTAKNALFDHLRLFGRPAFQLADHIISSNKKPDSNNDNEDYAYANSVEATDASKRPLMGQKLYRHLIDVSRQASTAAQELLLLRPEMPGVESEGLPRLLRKHSEDKRFSWQDEAAQAIRTHRSSLEQTPFFGILIAGTGSGKTIGALKIIASFKGPMRVIYASPLRSLTLQSGSEFETLGFAQDDLATVIGDPLIQKIHDSQKQENDNTKSTEVIDAITETSETDQEAIDISGGYVPSELIERTKVLSCLEERGMRMVATPILAATLDTVMKLADARRGSYLSHLLRIASSDLIIDEADMYSPVDLLAIGRLIESCGFWRSKVILSSATLSPIIANAFFRSYSAGLKRRNSLDGIADKKIPAAWFSDTQPSTVHPVATVDKFNEIHNTFAASVAEFSTKTKKRKVAGYIPQDKPKIMVIDPSLIIKSVKHLHNRTSVKCDNDSTFSFGCIQVVNVKHCQEIAMALCNALKTESINSDLDYRVICLHGRLSLATRNMIDSQLNIMLNRKGPTGDLSPLKNQDASDFIHQSTAKQKVIILVSTMETTGRDHDFDWGIIESRQERDIIQFAGRIRRHRPALDGDQLCNLMIWNVPLKWNGLQLEYHPKPDKNAYHPFSRYGVADRVAGSITHIPLFSKEIDPVFGFMPTYTEMMKLTYGLKMPFINPSRILTDSSMNPNECKRVDGVDKTAYTVRACETARLNSALLDSRATKTETLVEWLSDPNQAGRLLNKHQNSYRFRSGHPMEYYWRDENDDWYFIVTPGREWDKAASKKQGPYSKLDFTDSTLLFKFSEEDEVIAIQSKTNSFSRKDRVRISGVTFTEQTDPKQMQYHSQIGLIKEPPC